MAGLKWLWGILVKALLFILSLLPEPEPAAEVLPPATPPIVPENEMETHLLKLLPEVVRKYLNIAYAVFIIGLVLFALWQVSSQLLGWFRRKLADLAGMESEPLHGAFREDLISLFILLKTALLRMFKLLFPFWNGKRKSKVLPEVASVRQVYRQLLSWAASGGYPRQRSQTPDDYFYTLVDLLPGSRVDLQLITEYYVNARYGTFLPADDELGRIKQSWHRVKQNELKKILKKEVTGQEEDTHE